MKNRSLIADSWRKTRWRAAPATALFAAALAVGCGVTGEVYDPRSGMAGGVHAYKVTRVITGDSLVLEMDGNEVAVRLVGIDAPPPKNPDREARRLGRDAQRFAQKLVARSSVFVEFEGASPTRDQYGRLLAYLYRYPDRLPVNAEIVKQGYARSVDEWACRRHDELEAAEAEARSQGKGIWASPAADRRKTGRPKKPEMDPTLP